MPRPGTIYSSFVASPSDLSEDRDTVEQVVLDWNSNHSRDSGAIIQIVRWERDSAPEMGSHPQAIINKRVIEWCDLCIAIFWTKVGTPTLNAESGTIEEIEAFLQAGKPVLLYFCSRPTPPNALSPSELARLEKIKQHYRTQGLCSEYTNVSDLHRVLANDLAKWMHRLHRTSATGMLSQDPFKAAPPMPESSPSRDLADELGPIARRFQAQWQAERDSTQPKVQDAKYLLQSLQSELIELQAATKSAVLPDVSRKITEYVQACANLNKHMLFLDGGHSFREFWSQGDKLVANLQDLQKNLMNN